MLTTRTNHSGQFFLEELQTYVSLGQDGAEMNPSIFALPVVVNSDILRSADYSSINLASNAWIAHFSRYKRDPFD